MPGPAAKPDLETASGGTAILLDRLRPQAAKSVCAVEGYDAGYVLFFSATAGPQRATIVTARASSFAEAWHQGAAAITRDCPDARLLRLDWVIQAQPLTIEGLRRELAATKRNYFRLGISLDERFEHSFLETELNANAMLYGGNRIEHALLNERNFLRYATRRHGITEIDFSETRGVWVFVTSGLFVSNDDRVPVVLHGTGRNTGRRIVERLDISDLDLLIANGSAYLARQTGADGRFSYGCHPCFDRPIGTYNNLRHASTLHAMLEAWEVTRDAALRDAIERATGCLVDELVREVEQDGEQLAFLVEPNNEIKLGGNGVTLLALVKYAELFGTDRFRDLTDSLARGILCMQDAASGSFVHVLSFPSLEVKDPFRIIYYEGEAAFGLLRLYRLTGERRWMRAVERAFAHFIRKQHWRAHDHWLGYCVNELTRHRPAEPYFRFGLRNIRGHLDFVLGRITTFPTLLELMTSAEELVARIAESDQHRGLLGEVDRDHLYEALHFRAHYLLNGYFWPELAMFYERPDKISGSFFIRHHAFRVRIDDVEHYLSGLIAYRRFLLERGDRHPADPATLEWKPSEETGWNARNVPLATGGNWRHRPPARWSASGVYIHPPGFLPGRMAAVRLKQGEKGVAPVDLHKDAVLPSAVISSDPDAINLDVPKLWVENPQRAVMDLALFARDRFSGRVVGVTGSAGKTTMVAMMAHTLRAFGLVGSTEHNANLPLGAAWNLASMRWTDPHVVLELSIGRMAQSARLARPDVAIFTNVLPAHLEHHQTVEQVARLKSGIFLGMTPGSVAVLNRDMDQWDIVHDAAIRRGLRIVHYGFSDVCDCRLLAYDPERREVNARIQGESVCYVIGAPGEHMALNSLAAIAASIALGHSLEPVIGQLGSFTPLAGRGAEFETSIAGHRIAVIDEAYNANPGSMRAALRLLGSKMSAPRRVAVLGEMAELGPESAIYHTELAPLFEENGIDRVHLVGSLYTDLWDALPADIRASRTGSLKELRQELQSDLADGDCVLFKGSHSTGIHKLIDSLRTYTPHGSPDLPQSSTTPTKILP